MAKIRSNDAEDEFMMDRLPCGCPSQGAELKNLDAGKVPNDRTNACHAKRPSPRIRNGFVTGKVRDFRMN